MTVFLVVEWWMEVLSTVCLQGYTSLMKVGGGL